MFQSRIKIPALARIVLTLAYWPTREYTDQLLSLHRGYNTLIRKGKNDEAREMALQETKHSIVVVIKRIPWWVEKLINWVFTD